MALLDDYMSHIINGADITDLLPDGIALEDKMAISGWFNNELANLVLTSLENAKLTRLNEFRKWVLKNGKSLSKTQFRAWCKYIAKAYPRLERTIQAFFDGLERAFGEFDITMMSGGTAFVKAMSQAFTKAGVEASSVALAEALAAGRKREAGLAEQARELRAQLTAARKALQDATKLTHSGSVAPASISERRVRFATVQEWIAEEIRSFWIETYTPADRRQYPLDSVRWTVLPSFADTFQKLDDNGMDKAIRAATHIVTTRRAAENMFESHALREGDESSKPEVTRADGATAQRAYIESHTPQSRRLHYWKLRDGSIELSRVGLHDDFTP
jgi:hypothetical protein